jgi:rare lipoprotein A (peptidoglycan hydrolase)
MGNPVRAIDLSPEAFAKLAPLSRGVVDVSVTTVELPATDTE